MKFLRAVMAISLITLTSGCGGPHVTGSDPANPGSTSSESSTASAPDNTGEGIVADPETLTSADPVVDSVSDPILDLANDADMITSQAPTDGTDGQDGANADGGNGGAGGAGGAGGVAQNGNDGQSTNGADGTDGINGANGESGTAVVVIAEEPAVVQTPPAPVVPVVINGQDGRDGAAGRDGRDADNGPYDATTFGLSESALMTAATDLALPYVLREEGGRRDSLRIQTLGQGRRNNGAGNQLCDSSISSCAVKNSMVIFQVRVPLPARNSILATAPFDANLSLNIRKISASRSSFDSTESICLLEASRCSGHYFMTLDEERAAGMRITNSSYDWSRLISPRLAGGQAMVNDIFSRDLAAAAANHREGRTIRYLIPAMPINLAQYFGANGQDLSRDELMNLLYGDADPAVATIRTLTFVVSDDIMVVDAKLTMTYSWR